MLGDDDGNGVLNYMEPTHPCYQGLSPVLAPLATVGFGFASINNSEIRFNTNSTGLATIEMFTISGHSLGVVFQGNVAEGAHTALWKGNSMRQGMYLFRLTQGTHSQVINIPLIHATR